MRKSLLLLSVLQFTANILFCQSSDSIRSAAFFNEGVMLYNHVIFNSSTASFIRNRQN